MKDHLKNSAARGRDERGRDSADRKKSKTERDIVLLRLDKGAIAELDEASVAAGLSRAAFARQRLMPLARAYAAKADAIAKRAAENGESFEAFALRAFDIALAPTGPTAPPGAIAAAMEFDALFGAG